MKKSQTFKRSLPILFAATLAACGGGGSDAPAPTPAPAPAPAALAEIVTSVPTPTYAAASEALAAFNTLNAERSRCGFGMVAQDPSLDAAALDHAKWRLLNDLTNHTQTGGNGFTAETPVGRAAYRGYPTTLNSQIADEIATAFVQGTSGQGAALTRVLLSAPYHALGMLDRNRDVGIAVLSDLDVGSTATSGKVATIQVNLGTKPGIALQNLPADTLVTYPCEGTIDVHRALYNETPNPIPNRDLATNPAGVAVMLRVRTGSVINIGSSSIVKVSDGAPVAMRTPTTAENDPHRRTPVYAPFILADAPLAPLTAYRATITGTLNGKAFSKEFTFTTAAD